MYNQIFNQPKEVEDFCLGTNRQSKSLTDNLYVHVFTVNDYTSYNYESFPASNIITSECYSGSPVGHGTAWTHETSISLLLAQARVLSWDYGMGIKYDL